MAQAVNSGLGLYANTVDKGPMLSITTITAFVEINGQGTTKFLLTCGHSFFDNDSKNRTPLPVGPPDQNNYTGLTPAGVPPIDARKQLKWALKFPRYYQPVANSYGQYHCPGDKLNSLYDGGLALIDDGTRTTNVTVGGFTVHDFDVNLPPANDPATSDLYLGKLRFLATHRANLLYRPAYTTHDGLTYNNVYLVDINDSENTLTDVINWKGMSGTSLYRVPTGTQPDPANPPNATIIAYFCSRVREQGSGPDDWFYLFQCIGTAVQDLQITRIAPSSPAP